MNYVKYLIHNLFSTHFGMHVHLVKCSSQTKTLASLSAVKSSLDIAFSQARHCTSFNERICSPWPWTTAGRQKTHFISSRSIRTANHRADNHSGLLKLLIKQCCTIFSVDFVTLNCYLFNNMAHMFGCHGNRIALILKGRREILKNSIGIGQKLSQFSAANPKYCYSILT